MSELNEEILGYNSELIQLKLQKTTLQEELRHKNEQLFMTRMQLKDSQPSESPKKQRIVEAMYERTNQAIEEVIQDYQKDAEKYRAVLERQEEDHGKLREELISSHLQIEMLKEDIRVIRLKDNTQQKNQIKERDNKIHAKDNEIKYLQNKLTMLQERYANAQREI